VNALLFGGSLAWLALVGVRRLVRRPVESFLLTQPPAPGSTDDRFLAQVFFVWTCEELARLSCEADEWSRRV
jgi:hypothetical protein